MRQLAILVLAVSVAAPVPAATASTVSVEDLVENGARYDGEEITVEGELIGDYGFRSDGWTWTQLNGDPYVQAPLREGGEPQGVNVGVGVRMPRDLAIGLDPPGRYRRRGPVVQLTATWRYQDSGRQGESYLDVSSLAVVEPGRPLEEEPDTWMFVLGLSLLGAAALVWRRRTG